MSSRRTSITMTIILFSSMIPLPSRSTLFPYTTLFRSQGMLAPFRCHWKDAPRTCESWTLNVALPYSRSEEHTLNSSHPSISYAVFCLKKKTEQQVLHPTPENEPLLRSFDDVLAHRGSQ